MKNNIIFVTANKGKFDEVVKFISELDPTITVEQAALDLPEIQSLDVEKISVNKAELAWEQIKKPLIVDDGGIYLDQYNNRRGTLLFKHARRLVLVPHHRLLPGILRRSILASRTAHMGCLFSIPAVGR